MPLPLGRGFAAGAYQRGIGAAESGRSG